MSVLHEEETFQNMKKNFFTFVLYILVIFVD